MRRNRDRQIRGIRTQESQERQSEPVRKYDRALSAEAEGQQEE